MDNPKIAVIIPKFGFNVQICPIDTEGMSDCVYPEQEQSALFVQSCLSVYIGQVW